MKYSFQAVWYVTTSSQTETLNNPVYSIWIFYSIFGGTSHSTSNRKMPLYQILGNIFCSSGLQCIFSLSIFLSLCLYRSDLSICLSIYQVDYLSLSLSFSLYVSVSICSVDLCLPPVAYTFWTSPNPKKKYREHVRLARFWIGTVLRAEAACTSSTS